MNIAILIPELNAGGAERAAAMIGNYYSKQGNKVYYFLFAGNNRSFYTIDGEIIRTHIFSPFAGSKSLKTIVEVLFASNQLKKLEKKYAIDVSLSFMEEWNFINGIKKRSVRRVSSVRTVLSERKEFSGILYEKKWLKRVLSGADNVIAVSDYVRKDLIETYNINEKKVHTISNVSVKRDVLTGETWQYGKKVVVAVGRLDQVKQHERIIVSFEETLRDCSDAQLCIVGDGKLMGHLKKMIEEKNLTDKVFIVGAQKDVSYFYSNARAFVMASRVEGFPNAMVEAMSFGLPIITTDSPGGCGELVGREKASNDIQYCRYGVLTPVLSEKKDEDLSREEKLLGKAMANVLNDDELHKKYEMASYERSKMYSYDSIMKLWDKALGIV